MKHILLLCSLFLAISTVAQPAGKKYTLKNIGWTIMLPPDFMAFSSEDSSIQIVPGQGWNSSRPMKRLMTAMSGPNLFVVTITSCDPKLEIDNSALEKQTYKIQAKGDGVKLDSATTLVSIDGVTFKKFRITERKNNLIVYDNVILWTCYRGFYLGVTYNYFNGKIGEEIAAMLRNSSFH